MNWLGTLLIAGALGMSLMSAYAGSGKYANAIASAGGLQGRILWCDAEANLWELDCREKVAALAGRCKEVNINTIVIDVKPIAGVVLYKSKIAPRLTEWSGRKYPQNYDLLKTMIEEGHRVGIDVYAGINVFAEGTAENKVGPAFSHPDWQCIKYEIEGRPRFVPVGEAADEHLAVFVNPADPKVREYELSIIKEIATNYEVDGIVFDRMRYPGIYADFSNLSRRAFERWLGEGVERFPEDILTIDPLPDRPIVYGKHFAKWMEWRAKQIRDFVAEARDVVKSTRPEAKVAAYVGSWYGSYYDVGVNWASKSYHPPYPWAGPTYKETGYAELLDWICTGCYYENPTMADARAAGEPESASVEFAGMESTEVVMDSTFVYGSLYLLQYKNNPTAFERAIAASMKTTQGVMLFDLVYVRDYNWWDVLKRAFASPTKAPHAVPGLMEKVADIRRLVEESGRR